MIEREAATLSYRQFSPSPRLAPYVDRYWVIGPAARDGADAPGADREMRIRVAPDCRMDMVFDFTGTLTSRDSSRPGRPGALLSGASLAPMVLFLGPGFRAAGARFWPGGAAPFIGEAADLFTNGGAPLGALLPGFSSLALSLSGEAKSAGETARVLDRLLGERLRAIPPIDALTVRAVRALAASGGRVDVAAGRMGVGLRRLERALRRQVGLTPKGAARSLRLTEAMRVLAGAQPLPGRPGGTLAELSLGLGFSDQAHFTNEFTAMAGVSPAAWLTERRDVAFLQYLPSPLP